MTLRLASYNIRKAVGLDRRRDPYRIVGILNELGADVIALQEADQRLGNRPAALPPDLIARETDFDLVPLAGSEVSIGWHGNALLIRRGLQVENASRIALPGLEPRGAVQATIRDGDRRLTVIGTHLGLLRSWRQRQLDRLARKAARTEGPVAIMGDFNEWSPSSGFEPLGTRFELHAPGQTFHAARPVAALDRFALGAGIAATDAGVLQTAQTRIASDHLPVWLDAEMTQGAGLF